MLWSCFCVFVDMLHLSLSFCCLLNYFPWRIVHFKDCCLCYFWPTWAKNTFISQMKSKKEETRQTETLRMKTELFLNMKEVWLNNAGVVSVGHGIEPPGVSHRPVGPSRGSAQGERRRPEDGHRAFLSQPHPAASTRQAWPSHEPLHSWVVFVRWQACWEISAPERLWPACLVTPRSQWGIHWGHRRF